MHEQKDLIFGRTEAQYNTDNVTTESPKYSLK